MPIVAPHATLRIGDLGFRARSRRFSALSAGLALRTTYNGRGALYQVFRSLRDRRRNTVLVPAFQCPTVVDPAMHAGCDVEFYEVDAQLRINREAILERLSDDVLAVVLINYFGVEEELDGLIAECRRRGVLVVEDCSHSFLRTDPLEIAGGRGDLAVFSFWKLIPSRVGGGIRVNPGAGAFDCDATRVPGAARSNLARQLLSDAAGNLLAPRLLDALRPWSRARRARSAASTAQGPVERQPADVAYPYDRVLAAARMPGLAHAVLEASDLPRVAHARREHFALLQRTLGDNRHAQRVIRELPSRCCPWGYPMLLRNRRDNDYRLRARGVPVFTFGEVLHPAVDEPRRASPRAAEMAHFLAEHLLVLGIHQDLHTRQLEDACAVMNAFDWTE